MRRILVVCTVVALAVVASRAAVAQAPDLRGPAPAPVATATEGSVTTAVRAATQKRSHRPLVLPNIQNVTRKLLSAERPLVQRQLVASRNVLRFWGNHRWVLAPRKEKCWEVPWQRSCTAGRHSLKLHTTLSLAAKDRLNREIPLTTNWTRAMRAAQIPFPGTYDWLEFISNRECRACYTTSAFICNYQGSGACGPMQFMAGTFYGHADDAKEWLDRHGYITDPKTWVWSSQLGQALTAAYMRYTGQDNCHWCL